MRRLPGPAVNRLGDGGNSRGSLRIVSGLAENTNSIFCDGSSELETANGCPVLQGAGTTSREATRAGGWPDQKKCALSRARPGLSRFFLTDDLHGWRFGTKRDSQIAAPISGIPKIDVVSSGFYSGFDTPKYHDFREARCDRDCGAPQYSRRHSVRGLCRGRVLRG